MADEATSSDPKDSQPKERLIRVFVSSTFRDMQDEREVLVKRVFPELRKLCDERGVVFRLGVAPYFFRTSWITASPMAKPTALSGSPPTS